MEETWKTLEKHEKLFRIFSYFSALYCVLTVTYAICHFPLVAMFVSLGVMFHVTFTKPVCIGNRIHRNEDTLFVLGCIAWPFFFMAETMSRRND